MRKVLPLATILTLAAMTGPSVAAGVERDEDRAVEPQPLPEAERTTAEAVAAEEPAVTEDAEPPRASPAARRAWQIAGGMAMTLPMLVLSAGLAATVPPLGLGLTLPLTPVLVGIGVHHMGMRWLEHDFSVWWAIGGAAVGLVAGVVAGGAAMAASMRCAFPMPGSTCTVATARLLGAVFAGGLVFLVAAPSLGALWFYEVARLRAEAGATRSRRPAQPRGLIETYRLLPAPPAVIRVETGWIGHQPLLHLVF